MGEQLGFGGVGDCRERQEPAAEGARGKARLVQANRKQIELRSYDLDSLLEADHPARLIWAFTERLDLSAYKDAIRSCEGGPGRPAIDPAILLTLWLYATTQRVGHARRLEALCESHDAYRWICGGVKPNYHTLSDFRTKNEAAMDDLLVQTLGVLMHQKIVTVKMVAQDGLRVRASAGKKSFRRRKTLERCLEEAQARVESLKKENGVASKTREDAAAQRAAREAEERLNRALKDLTKLEEQRAKSKDKRKRSEPRASTTDADARIMRMADGGFRPGYNVQLATDVESGMVVGVAVTNGNDSGQVEPMLEDIEQRTKQVPEKYLVDGGYSQADTIEHAASKGTQLYAPVPEPKKAKDPYAPRVGDSLAVQQWRARMGSPEGKELYKIRAATAERTNADIRHWRGLDKLVVRGIKKVRCVVVMTALAYDLMHLISITRGLAG